ncbi:MAG TPA: PAS domain-containing protein, partial [Verrucomicrobiae bacterium]|nr:PAS domain-containing protein [Verrucomicrobiae bacterium]
MQTPKPPRDSPPEPTTGFPQTFTARVTAALKQAERVGTEHRLLTLAVGFLIIAGLGCIRLSVGRGPNFEFLYLFSCAVIGWLAGIRAGLASVALSASLLFVSEMMRGQVSSVWIFAWDSLVRLLAFASMTWLVARVGRESRELGRVVVQRTARLQSAEKQHEQTSELLLEATQLFRQVTENITDVFWVTDPSRRQVEYISPGFERLWGRSTQDLYAAPSAWVEGIYHEDRERVTNSMFSRQVSGEYDEEYRVVRTDGSVHWVHDRAFPVKDENGRVYRVVGIAEDITERKRAEQLLRAERDIGAALSST